ncbi:SDR family NAD(P)-dependent oxidoreductase [Aliagarivorans taiwanensis]|uniref:SDR family NAD(P)-dependent oxidoreductase n=1 Tax=Aliagarivorans taiwanensis TaxID=561966 RepID=UPI000418399F|nr:SDR family oxidoreductase [Aliagarivorans taiwanensis]
MKQVIVITGATGGIGQLLVKNLCGGHRHIVCVGRREGALQRLVDDTCAEKGLSEVDISYVVADMSEPVAVESAAMTVAARHGHIDMWINNVGVNNHAAMGPTWDVDASEWWKEVQLNLFTAYLGSAAAAKAMKPQARGYIVNLGGGGADKPKPFGSAYGSAKAAIVKFSETLNQELIEQGLGLRAFCFNPGFIRNQRTETLVASEVAKKYMPNLEEVLNSGAMSDIADSVALLEAILSGDLDKLSGRYLLADSFQEDIQQPLSDQLLLLRHQR